MRPIILLLLFLATGCTSTPSKSVVPKDSIKTTVVPVKDTPVPIVTPIEISNQKADMSNLPSYAQPHMYHIKVIDGKYFGVLPGGTFMDDTGYNTPQEAQSLINERAKGSLKRYLESHGTDY